MQHMMPIKQYEGGQTYLNTGRRVATWNSGGGGKRVLRERSMRIDSRQVLEMNDGERGRGMDAGEKERNQG